MATINNDPPLIHGSRPTATLPDDIIFYQIFPRLPVKSLHRFRCVSTFCRRLTSDRGFLAAVRRHAPRRYFLSFSTSIRWRLAVYSLQESGTTAAAARQELRNPPDDCTYANIINGITCTVHSGQNVVVSNLAANERSHLPAFLTISRRDRMFFYFCHDPSTNRYKVLRTVAVGAYSNPNDAVMRYSVFTLGKKSWRNSNLPYLYQYGSSKSACINGILYLTKFKTPGADGVAVIGAFSIRRERFNAVRYPNGLSLSRYNYCHLIELKGALAVIDVEDFMSCEIRLWVKERSSGWTQHMMVFDSRWETIYSLSLNYCFSTNLDGEIVLGSTRLHTSYGCWIFVYNMEDREWRRVEIQGIYERVVIGNLRIVEYVESPLLVRQIMDLSTQVGV